jgi:hypothetical protein
VFLPRHELQFQWSLLRPKNLDFRYMLQCSRKRALFIAEFVAEAISKGATLHIDGFCVQGFEVHYGTYRRQDTHATMIDDETKF